VTYLLYRSPHPGCVIGVPAYATLAAALKASDIPPACWSAVVSTHPDEIVTFYSVPGVVPGNGAQWIIRADGVAAEFCRAERAAGRLPAIGVTS
jgi:hypothetical protein